MLNKIKFVLSVNVIYILADQGSIKYLTATKILTIAIEYLSI